MHRISLTKALNLGKPFGDLAAGDWLVQDQHTWEIGMIAERGSAKASIFTDWPAADSEKVLIVRSGAYGDLLFLGPALRAFRQKFPEKKIHLSAFEVRHQLFEGTDLVDVIEPYPFPAARANEFESIICLENVMEAARDEHATDAFAKALGVTVTDYKPVYHLDRREVLTAMTRVVHGRPKLGVQMRASVANRDYPAGKWLKVLSTLESRGWEIFLLGTKSQIGNFPPEQFRSAHIHNLANAEYTFRESAAILAQMDAFVGVDSVWLHMCHALDIPAVGLYGPMPWKIRTSKAPKTEALTGLAECAPCHHHVHAGFQFPRTMPCAKTGLCLAMDNIDPMRIVAKVDNLKPAFVSA